MNVEAVAGAIRALRPKTGLYIVGVTGSVASGKSTLAQALVPVLAADGARVELISTDGFLLDNSVLAERGLELRKGWPETYDLAALAAALAKARQGPVTIPAYSHVTYDIDPAAARELNLTDILIVEGLALGLDRPPVAGRPALIDCLVYLDASEADLETWFVTRFMGFWAAAAEDPTSFYRRFRSLDAAGAEDLAHKVWTGINLPNLREHIAPVRVVADLVVVKASDHSVTRVLAAGGEMAPPRGA